MAALGAAIVFCCVAGFPNLYDKYLISRFVLAFGCLSLFFLFALVSKKELLIPKSWLFQLLVVTALYFGTSVAWATNTGEALFSLSTWLLALLVSVVFFNLLSTDYQAGRKVLWISCAIVLLVYLAFACFQMLSVEDFSFDQLYGVSGINGHKNLLSVMLFLLSVFLLGSIPFIKRWALKVVPLLLFAMAVIIIVMLKSRAALLGVIAAALWFGLTLVVHGVKPRFSRKLRTSVLVVSNVLALAFFIVGLRWFVGRSIPETANRSEVEYNMMSTSSLVERSILWDKTYQIVDKKPVFGYGIGNWQIHFPDASLKGLYRSDFWSIKFTKPHNEYLGVLSEGGYVGLVLFIAFLVSLVVSAFFAICETKDRKEFLFGAFVLSAFIGSYIDAMFDFPNSRVEHLIWMGISCAILLRFIVGEQRKSIQKGWYATLLLLSALGLMVGAYRFKGERHTFDMQQAMKRGDWAAMEQHSALAVSPFYTIDPLGMPMHWYLGKAMEKTGNPLALHCFRAAYRFAPYCRENLNDLGLEEYYMAHDMAAAEFCFREAIRISPGYLCSYFNLAYMYLDQNEVNEAHMVMDQVYMSEEMRDVLLKEAAFYESKNVEVTRQKIIGDYEATMRLRQTISQLEANEGSVTNVSSSER